MTENELRIQQYFEREAGDFDASYGSSKNIKDVVRRASYFYNRRPIENRLNALLQLMGEDVANKTILEVGCGPGVYSIRLAHKGATVSAIDYSHSMVDLARQNVGRAGVLVDVQQADFLALPEAGTFDSVFATGVIEYVARERHREFLAKMARLSRDSVIVSFPKRGGAHRIVRNAWLRLFKNISISFFGNADIAALARDAGLVEIERKDAGVLWVVKFRHA
jgi:2-polyprenyl-3-methyl-5-hydroxy-6-metoxy-1,4-benzoquinol methylase